MFQHVQRNLNQPHNETHIANELRHNTIIKITAFKNRHNDNAQRKTANHTYKRLTCNQYVLNTTIKQSQRLTHTTPNNLRYLLCLGHTNNHQTFNPKLTLREIKNGNTLTFLHRLQQHAHARELDVV